MPSKSRIALVLPGLLAGCMTDISHWTHIDNAADIPRGALPSPNGSFVNRFVDVQAAKAEADDFVVYNYEWYMGGTDLGPFGHYHLSLMLRRLPEVPFPIMIQAQPDPAINEARRQMMVLYLSRAGVPDAELRVVVGYPEAEGLYGEEAERVYNQMMGGRGTGGGGNGAQREFGPFDNRTNPFGGFRGGLRGGFGGGISGF